MPELPEIHTTVEGLKKTVIGKTIKDVWSDYHLKTAHGEKQTIKNKKYFVDFKRKVKGAEIIGAERRGKNILINLNNDHTILVHLKLTGALIYKKEKQEKYVHLIFIFESGDYLLLSDLRKFASVILTKTNDLYLHDNIKNLGPDPFRIELKEFRENIKKKKNWPIKSTLLDQGVVAGIGNIYSDEILWQTSIHPLSYSEKIPEKKFKDIFKVMQKILHFSIKHGGDSKSDYRNIYGEKGGFQDFHKAYGKKNKKCPKRGCGGIIARMVVRGRSAHFCPEHQILYQKKIYERH